MDSCQAYDSVVVLPDLVVFYDEFLAEDCQNSLTSAFCNCIPEYEVINIVRALYEQINFETCLNLVFLKKN